MPENGSYLSRDQVLRADDLEREEVEVPEWGGKILCRCLTALERSELRELSIADHSVEDSYVVTLNDGREIRLRKDYDTHVVVRGTIEQDGSQKFELEDVELLNRKNPKVIERISAVIGRLSALDEEHVDELGKDSEDQPSDVSSSV